MPNNMRTEADEKRDKIIRNSIISVIVIIVLAVVISVVLYITTDMLKSEKTLFLKYAQKSVESLNIVGNVLNNSNLPEEVKSETKTEYSINHVKNTGTTSEIPNESINKLKFTVEEQKDDEENYNYKNIKLTSGNEQLLQVEYLKNGENAGVKALDIEQYLYKTNSDTKDLAKQFEVTDEQIDKISDISEVNSKLPQVGEFSIEEKEILQQKYSKIINDSFDKENFSKKKRQKVTVNGKEIITNAYVLTTTKEKMNHMYINMLETLKQDDIIIAKIEKMQEIYDKLSLLSEEKVNLKEKFENDISKEIENINKSNIGNEAMNVVVYENDRQAVKTEISMNHKKINLSCIQIEGEEFLEINIQKNDETVLKSISFYNSNKKSKIYIENNEKTEQFKLTIDTDKEMTETNNSTNTSIIYEIEKEKVEAKINRITKKVDSIANKQMFTKENSIQLDNLDEEKLTKIKEIISEERQKEKTLLSEKIKSDDVNSLFNAIGLKKTIEILEEGAQISEVEKDRFNSKFEFLQGKELDGERMLQEIEVFKDNILDFIVVSNDVLKIEMNRTRKGDERIVLLEDFIKKEMRRQYDVTLEYNETTGLVKYIVMTIVRDKR